MATVLITGANRGVGLALSRLYHQRGDRVIAACRSAPSDLRAIGVDVEEGVDVTDAESLAALADRLAGRGIDVLINNAGILIRDAFDDADPAHLAEQYATNAIGPLMVTRALAPLMKEGGKVAIVSSIMGSIAETGSGGFYGYRMSKAAANMAGAALAHDLRSRGIAVILLHPGYVATDMTNGQGTVRPEDAAAGLAARIDALAMADSGSFWHAEGRPLAW